MKPNTTIEEYSMPDEYFDAEKNLLTPRGKKIWAWFKRPFKKVGKLYGITFVTIKPFPNEDHDQGQIENKVGIEHREVTKE